MSARPDRYFEIATEHGIRPFERIPWVNPRTEEVEPGVLGVELPIRWRVSRDEWDALVAWAKKQYEFTEPADAVGTRMLGWPIAPDDSLPPRSIILEPDPGAS